MIKKIKAYGVVILVLGYILIDTLFIVLSSLFGMSPKKGSRIIQNHYKKCARLLDLKVKQQGQFPTDMMYKRPLVFMCNHISALDIVVCFSQLPQLFNIRMVAKKELFKIFIFGRAMQILNFIPVDRRSRAGIPELMTQCMSHLNSGFSVLFFPEGTRSKTNELLPFKKGGFRVAIAAKALIVPLGIAGTSEALPTQEIDQVKRGVSVGLVVGPCIDTENYTLDTLDQLVEQTAAQIQSLKEVAQQLRLKDN